MHFGVIIRTETQTRTHICDQLQSRKERHQATELPNVLENGTMVQWQSWSILTVLRTSLLCLSSFSHLDGATAETGSWHHLEVGYLVPQF